jgi:hypothetical protein
VIWKNLIEEKLNILSTRSLISQDVTSSIDEMLNVLDSHPQLTGVYSRVVGKEEKFTLKRHTSTVISQYMNYFFIRNLPIVVPKDFFLLLLALHDLGKPLAIDQGDRNLQHTFTCRLINNIKEHLPFDVQNILALINGDPLGRYFIGVELRKAIIEIRDMVKKSSLSLKDFFHLLIIFYQVDAGSYAIEEGENSVFSAIFRKDFPFYEEKQRLWFSPNHEKLFNRLENALFAYPDSD